MALKKSLTRKNRIKGNYIALRYFWVDDFKTEARAYFALYESKTAATAAPEHPMIPIVAKVWLKGKNFQKLLGGSNRSKNPRRVLYKALREGTGVIADEGVTYYTTAKDD